MSKATGLLFNGEANISPIAPVSLRDRTRWRNNGVFTLITPIQLPTRLWVLSLNGATSLITVATNNFFDVVPPNGCVEMWVYLPIGYNPGGGYRRLFTKVNDETGGTVDYMTSQFDTISGALLFEIVRNGASTVASTARVSWTIGWHHFVIKWGVGGMIIYANGYPDGTNANTLVPSAGAARDFIFGASNFGGGLGSVLNGYIALPKLRNFALSPGNVIKRYVASRHWIGV